MEWATRQYLKSMSHGKRPKEIIAWLKAEGIKYRVGLDGWPTVLVAHCEKIFGGSSSARRPTPDVRLDHLKGSASAAATEVSTRPT